MTVGFPQEVMSKELSPAFAACTVDVYYLHSIAKSLMETAGRIQSNAEDTHAFYVLTSVACELFGKIIPACRVCLEFKDNSMVATGIVKEAVTNKLKCLGHDLKTIYNDALNKPILSNIGVKEVAEFKNDHVFEYRFTLKDGNIVIFKDIESIRYGTLAVSPNAFVGNVNAFNPRAVSLLTALSQATFTHLQDSINELKGEKL